MAGTILTPNNVWKNYEIESRINYEVLREEKENGVIFSYIFINGRTVSNGCVRIYGVLAKPEKEQTKSSVIVIQDYKDGIDRNLVADLAKRGYTAFCIDLSGNYSDSEFHTFYPESLKYANLDLSEIKKNYVEDNVDSTCWFEWALAIRYGASFLRGIDSISKVGAIGIGTFATSLWQAVAMDDIFDCAVFVNNIGWKGYESIRKFSSKTDPEFNENQLKFLAGIEPQAYAGHISCPTLVLIPTNSMDYDIDRAYDTVSLIKEEVYKSIDYSIGGIKDVNLIGYQNALIFFDKFLKGDKQNSIFLPKEISFKVSEENDTDIIFDVNVSVKDIKSVEIYCSENVDEPILRSWDKVISYSQQKRNNFTFEYKKSNQVKFAYFFAKAKYENGFEICSNIIYKSFGNTNETKKNHILIYSSRDKYSEAVFYPVEEQKKCPSGLYIKRDCTVKVISGPNGFDGVSCQSGLHTFSIYKKINKPQISSILLFDACVKGGTTIFVKLISNYFGDRTEYVATEKLLSSSSWQNIKLEQNKFKTQEGINIKNFDNIDALEFSSDGEFLINNVLWV